MSQLEPRTEYYKARGVTLAVSPYVESGGYHDTWEYTRRKVTHIGVRKSTLRQHYTLITLEEFQSRLKSIGVKP